MGDTKGPTLGPKRKYIPGGMTVAAYEALREEFAQHEDLIAALKAERDALTKQNAALVEACKAALANLEYRSHTRSKWTMADQQAFEKLDAALAQKEMPAKNFSPAAGDTQ